MQADMHAYGTYPRMYRHTYIAHTMHMYVRTYIFTLQMHTHTGQHLNTCRLATYVHTFIKAYVHTHVDPHILDQHN